MTREFSFCTAWLSAWLCACSATSPSPAASAADALDARRMEAALVAGRDQAIPCRKQIEHDADEFLDCIRVRSQPGFGGLYSQQDAMDQRRRLGVLFFGWFTADLDAAFALDGAGPGAQALLAQVMEMQHRLRVDDKDLCKLIDAPPQSILDRKKEAQDEMLKRRAAKNSWPLRRFVPGRTVLRRTAAANRAARSGSGRPTVSLASQPLQRADEVLAEFWAGHRRAWPTARRRHLGRGS